jgi:cytosine deaminase
MEVTRTYANTRWKLMNDPDSEVRRQAESCLTHPKFGTFVFLYAPDPSTPQGLMALGAYGSTMEGAVPQVFPSSLQFALLPGNSTSSDLANCAMKLPPFYRTAVQVSPASVVNTDLVKDLNDLIKGS